MEQARLQTYGGKVGSDVRSRNVGTPNRHVDFFSRHHMNVAIQPRARVPSRRLGLVLQAHGEHIVLSDGIYYYVDDAQKKLFTVNPDNYKAVPFDISTEGMAFSGAGEETVDGKTCRFEKYNTDSGSVTFYFYNAELYALTVEQGSVHTLLNITAFNKYLDSTLVTLPSSYNVVQYWPGA